MADPAKFVVHPDDDVDGLGVLVQLVLQEVLGDLRTRSGESGFRWPEHSELHGKKYLAHLNTLANTSSTQEYTGTPNFVQPNFNYLHSHNAKAAVSSY